MNNNVFLQMETDTIIVWKSFIMKSQKQNADIL